MKSLIFLLLVLSAVASASDAQVEVKVPAGVQEKVFDSALPDQQWLTGVETGTFQIGRASILELRLPVGIRFELEDDTYLIKDSDGGVVASEKTVRYQVAWHPKNHLVGFGIATEIIDHRIKTWPSIHISKSFHTDTGAWSFSLKPLWHHEEGKNPLGAMFWIRIDN